MIYFITETYLKTKTPITKNVDVNDVTPFIPTQSEMRVQPILGTFFYNDILTKYNNQTLSPNEEELVKRIQPVVAWRSAEDAVFNLTYQLKNKGLQKQNGDNSVSVDRSEMVFSMEHYSQKAEFYEKRLFKYLQINKNLFPVYTSKDNNDCQTNDINPTDDGDTGFVDEILII
jgi:hypothetical protein